MTGEVLQTFDESPGEVLSLAWSPDKRTLAIGGQTEFAVPFNPICLWDTVSGKDLPTLKVQVEEGSICQTRNLVWAPDGNTLACTINETIRIWDIQSGKSKQFSPGIASALTWSTDGKVLAFGNHDGAIRFWDVKSDRLRHSRISSSCGPVHSVSFSPDSKVVATCAGSGTVSLWDAHTFYTFFKKIANRLLPLAGRPMAVS